MTLKSDLAVSGGASTALTLSGDITAADGAGSAASARTVTMNGTGTLTLSGLQDYATLTTNHGTTNIDPAQSTGLLTVDANRNIEDIYLDIRRLLGLPEPKKKR